MRYKLNQVDSTWLNDDIVFAQILIYPIYNFIGVMETQKNNSVPFDIEIC